MLRGLVAAVGAAAAMALTGCSREPPPPPQPEGILATITTPPATPTTAHSPTSEPPTGNATPDGWYLAIGDSLAAGFQPGKGDQPTRGYAGPVLAELRKTQPGTALQNLGCSGETTTSMIKGGPCRYDKGSQLAAAVDFLKMNRATTRLVTLDLGANNVLRCSSSTAVDAACARTSTATVTRELGSILTQLRDAAPDVEIVVLSYYNPLLAAAQQGPSGQAVAAQSAPLLKGLNDTIRLAAGRVHAKVADVEGAFSTSDTSGSLPVNVARICDWTWMCSQQDIHANDKGYAAMAQAVLAAR